MESSFAKLLLHINKGTVTHIMPLMGSSYMYMISIQVVVMYIVTLTQKTWIEGSGDVYENRIPATGVL